MGVYKETFEFETNNSIKITHNLNSKDLQVSIWLMQNYKNKTLVTLEVNILDENTIELVTGFDVTDEQFRVIVASL